MIIMQKLGGFSKSPPFLWFSFALSSALLPPSARSFLSFIPSSPVPRLRRPHFAHTRAQFRVHSRTPAPPPISVFYLHPSPLYPNSLFINTQGVNISPHNPLHLPFTFPLAILPNRLRKSPTFSNTSPRISLATLPASPTAKSATEQVKAFSSKPSPLTL